MKAYDVQAKAEVEVTVEDSDEALRFQPSGGSGIFRAENR